MTDAPTDTVNLITGFLDDQARLVHDRLGDVLGVGITVMVAGLPLTAGASSEIVREIDAVQYDIGSGPCLQALEVSQTLYVSDFRNEPRWVAYGAAAAERGALSCVSVPVTTVADPDTAVAVVKAYSSEVGGITAEQQAVVAELAQQVGGGLALAVALSATATQLENRVEAMNSRRSIDLALGMLMERSGCGPEEAFDLLRRYSQHYNVKLREAATSLVQSVAGSQPGADDAPFT